MTYLWEYLSSILLILPTIMTELMQWEKLLTRKRLGKSTSEEKTEKTRTCFQQDYDRLVFSSPFRRLKDKTLALTSDTTTFVNCPNYYSI